MLLVAMVTPARGQNFVFAPLTTPAGCSPADSYTLYPAFSLDKIVVNQIYSDDGVTGSFAFDVYVHVVNVFDGTVLSTGTFYSYTPTLYSSVPNVPPYITNTSTIVPLSTANIANIPSSTNPTYVGSASALGLVLNGSYSSPDTLALFGYDSASLEVNLPCIGDVTEGGTVQPLPVVMSALNARAVNNKMVLSWTTYSERNHAGFSIARSADARTWEQLAWLPNTKGNTEIQTNYTYTDQSPLNGNNYYKIIQQDNDGRTYQSNVVVIKNSDAPDIPYTIFPNPAKDRLTVQAAASQAFHYKLSNMMGMSITEGDSAGGIKDIDVRNLSTGLYLLRVNNQVYPIEIYK